MSDTFILDENSQLNHNIKKKVYAAFIEEKTREDAIKTFYGVQEFSNANSSAFTKNMSDMIAENLISKSSQNGKTLYKSSIDPIYLTIEKRLNSSGERYDENDYLASRLIIDSDWFRNLFSNQMLKNSKDYECIKKYTRIDEREDKIFIDGQYVKSQRIQIEKPSDLSKCFMSTTLVTCIYLTNYIRSKKIAPPITNEDIVKAGSFDEIISKTITKKNSLNILFNMFCNYCKDECIGDIGLFKPGIPLVPDVLLRSIVSVSPFLPDEMFDIFKKMAIMNQLTLLNVYRNATEVITEKFEQKYK